MARARGGASWTLRRGIRLGCFSSDSLLAAKWPAVFSVTVRYWWSQMSAWSTESRLAKGVSEDSQREEPWVQSWACGSVRLPVGVGLSPRKSPGVLDRTITVIIDTCQGFALYLTLCPHCISHCIPTRTLWSRPSHCTHLYKVKLRLSWWNDSPWIGA